MLSDEQRSKDKWDNMVSIECPACSEIADRRPIQAVERTDELVGVMCRACGHRFDWPVPPEP